VSRVTRAFLRQTGTAIVATSDQARLIPWSAEYVANFV
jgi:hypothetical protein